MDTFKKHPFFEGVSESVLEDVLEGYEIKKFEKGEFVIRDGEPAQQCYLVLKGQISILTEKFDRTTGGEPELIAIQTLGPGELLGWSWLVPPHTWSMTAEANEAAEVLALDGVRIREQCEADPAFGYEMLKRVASVMKERLLLTRMQLALHGGQPFSQCEGG